MQISLQLPFLPIMNLWLHLFLAIFNLVVTSTFYLILRKIEEWQIKPTQLAFSEHYNMVILTEPQITHPNHSNYHQLKCSWCQNC